MPNTDCGRAAQAGKATLDIQNIVTSSVERKLRVFVPRMPRWHPLWEQEGLVQIPVGLGRLDAVDGRSCNACDLVIDAGELVWAPAQT